MKQLLSLILILFLATGISFGQTAASVNGAQATTKATPAVNAVEMSKTGAQCDPSASTTKSCCMGGSKATAITTSNTEVSEPSGKNCKSFSVGMSAAKPKEEPTKETPERP